jgi:hypothetical protein
MRRAVTRSLAGGLLVVSATSCRDLSGFSTHGGSYGGEVVGASFVLAGVQPGTKMCLTLDADHLQDAPGAISTDDGMFNQVPFRPIPQIWHDTLSTLTFGEGRLKNLLYVVTTTVTSDAGPPGQDVFAVVSLMQSGHVEVRLLRGAGDLFAIFDLSRSEGPCSF